MLNPGTRLGAYEITLPGSGGMGDVHRATDSRLGREVAVKVGSGPGLWLSALILSTVPRDALLRRKRLSCNLGFYSAKHRHRTARTSS